MNSYYHAKSSASKWGGQPADYQPIHDFIDSSKRVIGDVRHRSVYHHTEGTFLCERIFGVAIQNSAGKEVPTRLIAERHIIEDLGWLPTPADYIKHMTLDPWMSGAKRTEVPLSHLLGPAAEQPQVEAVEEPLKWYVHCGCDDHGDHGGCNELCKTYATSCAHPLGWEVTADSEEEAEERSGKFFPNELPTEEPPEPRRRRDPRGFGHMILDKPHR